MSRMKTNIETDIKNAIQQIGISHGIKILYACETGSRAWGFPSPDSDYDVRMIYMHPQDWYLSLTEKKDSLEQMLNQGDLDITGWDIRKCLRLLYKSNGALLERIQSPIVYTEVPGLVSTLQEAANVCFSPVATMFHYLGMAKTSFAEVENAPEVKLKKLFYALRAALACKWIMDKRSIPPIVFITMVNELEFSETLKNRIRELIQLKSTCDEAYVHPAETELNAFIMRIIIASEISAPSLSGRKKPDPDLDAVFLNLIKTYAP
jgi:predicted nucleotidyltransferase